MQKNLLVFIILAFAISSYSQSTPLVDKIESAKNSGIEFLPIQPFEKLGGLERNMETFVSKGNLFKVDEQTLDQLIENNPEAIELKISGSEDEELVLELIQQELLTADFKLKVNSLGEEDAPYKKGMYYQGIVRGSKSSLVALSFFEDEIIGIIESIESGQHVIGKLTDGSNRYILYNTADVRFRPELNCGSDQLEDIPKSLDDVSELGNVVRNLTNCVRVYIECEYDMYLEKGSITNTVNYMTGLFNVVATIYDNEQITTLISEIFVWDTPDTYATSSTPDALNSFRNARSSFNGDVAHLVSRGAPSGGGVAWVNALCSSFNYAYSYIYSSYAEFPTYSWSVEVFTHEMGHNLGSKHTHACVWNGNDTAIDGCGPAAGYSEGCDAVVPPSGTIMSYCHLVGGVGIDFNNGFGPQPGDLIRNRITNASCLTSCSSCTLTASINGTDVDCNGGNTGSATATPGAGNPPYSYTWSNSATTQTTTNLIAGNYTVTVTDDDNCTVITSLTINEPLVLSLSTNLTYETAPGANDGTIDLSVSGGSAPYTYLWSTAETTQDIAGLTAATYSVTATDANNCEASLSVMVEVCSMSVMITKNDVACNGDASGSSTANPAGGTSPYNYIWSNGGNTQTINNLIADNYSVTATDLNNCFASESTTINEQPPINLSTEVTNETSPGTNDGAIILNVSDGTPGYSYLWSNGPTTKDNTGLPAGTYSVDVTDSNGCVESISATVFRDNNCSGTVSSFPFYERFETSFGQWTNVGEFNWTRRSGSTPTGGTGPSGAQEGSFYAYTESNGNQSKTAILESPCLDFSTIVNPSLSFDYHMKGGDMGTLAVRISNDGGLYWNTLWSISNNQGNSWHTTNIDLSLYEGDPEVTIQIAGNVGNGNKSDMAIDAVNVDGTVPPCTAPTLNTTSNDASCSDSADGVASVSASGGVPPYSYSWSNGPTTPGNPGILSGTYSVTVTDAVNCSATTSVQVSAPSAINLSFATTYETAPGANDGTIDLSVSGGSAPYTYLWSTAETTQDITDLTAATYSVTVTDANNCVKSGSVEIIVAPACTTPYEIESFESGTGIWSQLSTDDFNWTVKSGTTPSGNTGPSSADDGSNYMYTEANGNGGKNAVLESSCVDLSLTVSPQFVFSYHMYGSNMGTLELTISDDEGVTWTSLWTESGNKGNSWNSAVVNLNNYAGQMVLFRITGYVNSGNPRSDMAIDKVEIIDTPPLPPGLTDGQKESAGLSLSPNPVNNLLTVDLFNFHQNNGELTIVDHLGRLVHAEQVNFIKGQTSLKIQTSEFSSGLFFITATNDTQRITKIFSVTH